MKQFVIFCAAGFYGFLSLAQGAYANTDNEFDSEIENPIVAEEPNSASRNSIFDVIFGKDEEKQQQQASKPEKLEEQIAKELPSVSVEESGEGKFAEVAVIKVIDLSLGKLYTLEIPVNSTKSLNDLSIKVVRCWEPAEAKLMPDSRALVEIVQNKKEGSIRLFNAWMFAAHPAVSHIEHPNYDVSLKSCKVLKQS